MLSFDYLPASPTDDTALIPRIHTLYFLDAFLLVLFSSPLIYLWVVKPFINERDEAMARITLLAHYDPLTKLANRRLIDQNLYILIAHCVRRHSLGALLLIDLDKFKPVNDNYGHDAGDALLVEIAGRLSSAMREEDVVGRVGGDEYVVLIDNLGDDTVAASEKILVIAQKLHAIVSSPLGYNSVTLQAGCSIGIALFGKEKVSMDAVYKHADIAMYQAKKGPIKWAIFSNQS